MSHKTLTSFVVCSSLVVIAALTVSSPVLAGPDTPVGAMQHTEKPMHNGCKDMMEQKKTLAADVKSQDAELTALVATMNRAPGDRQMTLMAAVITQIVEQQVAMNQRKAQMDDAMMAHMMDHMQMGKDSMAQCPMTKHMHGMKGMSAMPGMKSTDDKSVAAQ